MAIIRARSVKEYMDRVQQAVFEVEELYIAAESDMESMGSTANLVDKLNKELPFMGIVDKETEKFITVQVSVSTYQ